MSKLILIFLLMGCVSARVPATDNGEVIVNGLNTPIITHNVRENKFNTFNLHYTGFSFLAIEHISYVLNDKTVIATIEIEDPYGSGKIVMTDWYMTSVKQFKKRYGKWLGKTL